ncbi:MAG: N-acetyl-gamma-glutamyl-phosphate reductase [Candidatus Latescibacterota bacterium]|jgi:N-acetyl-gamma-glutamyl-phosphate reductase
MISVGIYGDTGMVGQEIQKVLAHHDQAAVIFKQNSKRQEGTLGDCDVVFLATKDPESMLFASEALAAGCKVIDMSGAFRLPREQFEAAYGLTHMTPELLKEAVYGMPALFAKEIASARLIGNPGCYPTSVILSLRPLKGLVQGEATVVSTSGNSGARAEVEETANEVTYSFGKNHKHVPEMVIYSGHSVNFTPIVLRSVFAGINSNIRIELADSLKALTEDEAAAKLRETIAAAYGEDDLVKVVVDSADHQWGTRDVVGTHLLLIKLGVDEGFVYINALEDNLGKGAASQAVENMNLMQGLSRLQGIDGAYKTGR